MKDRAPVASVHVRQVNMHKGESFRIVGCVTSGNHFGFELEWDGEQLLVRNILGDPSVRLENFSAGKVETDTGGAS